MTAYLEALAELERAIAAAAGAVEPRSGALFTDAARVLDALPRALAEASLPPKLAEACRAAADGLRGAGAEAARRLVRGEADAPTGIAAFLAWKAVARALAAAPLDDAAPRATCPVCGAAPAMAALIETERGRVRILACGRCETRWAYRRIGCPYCENDDSAQLGVLDPDDGSGFRIDVCRHCSCYLKTYVGARPEPLALADWTTLHLDAACASRGWTRGGPSLYEL